MGWFDRGKMSDEAGEWAALAMGCMCFADGTAGEVEITAARGQVATNPVLKDTIGQKRAEKLFMETVEAVAQIPSAMLASYEVRLQGLAEKIKDLDDKNFALATVIAVSMSDRSLTQGEHAMLQRFREMLGANIAVPVPGEPLPSEYRKAVLGAGVATAEAASDQATPPGEQDQPVTCTSCGKPTQYYQGYGHWCADCQRYAAGAAAPATPGRASLTEGEDTDPGMTAAKPPAQEAGPVTCTNCGKPTQYYEGYGHWCADCQRYAT